MKRRKQITEYPAIFAVFFAAVMLFSGCGAAETAATVRSAFNTVISGGSSRVEEIYEEAKQAVAGGKFDQPPDGTEAPGTAVERSEDGFIDFSNAADGYITVCYTGESIGRAKAQIRKDENTASYSLISGEPTVLPLSQGSGEYQISIFKNIEEKVARYALVLSAAVDAELKDEFAPFLIPNQYVNYSSAPVTAAVAGILYGEAEDTLGRVGKTFEFTMAMLEYDTELAATVEVGYLPELDQVLARRKGICFDYASLMTALLRLQGIPCRLVTGYAGSAFHAWISVWSEQEGWIEKVVFFDGESWQRMDPTFADSTASAKEVSEFVGDGSNYTEKNLY